MLICPAVLSLRPAMIVAFWGAAPAIDIINDSLAAFLAPTGFVYAILVSGATPSLRLVVRCVSTLLIARFSLPFVR